MAISKREMLERTKGVEDVTRRVHTEKLEAEIKDLKPERTNVNLSPKDKREIKEMMGTNNLSNALRFAIKEARDRRGML